MFRHKGCGGFVFPIQTIEVRCGLTLTPKGVQIVGLGKISRIAAQKESIKVKCSHCENEVTAEQVVANCMQCGNEFPLNELYVEQECAGIYCRNCSDKFYPDQKRVLASTALSKLAD